MNIKYFEIDLDNYSNELLLTFKHVTFINETGYPYDVYQGKNKILTVPANSQIDLKDVVSQSIFNDLKYVDDNVYIKIIPYTSGQTISIINYGR